MKPSAIRGLILEEIVLYLLTLVGYRVVKPGEEGTRSGKSGLEVKGRGEWHQIDALAAFDHTPPFIFPMRLMVEAKCYQPGSRVGIEIVRNSVGTLKDISENYFVLTRGNQGIEAPRYNYFAGVFSTSGYTVPAQRYALAHQIFLIQYQNIWLLKPVIESLLEFEPESLTDVGVRGALSELLRELVRGYLKVGDFMTESSSLRPDELNFLREGILDPIREIHGSYFGMLQGKWPMHLLSREALPGVAFAGRDEVPCRVFGRNSDQWSFAPSDIDPTEPGYFRLEFDIPKQILEVLREVRNDRLQVAQLKQEYFSYLDLVGRIDGIQRQVRLKLDEDWFNEYLERIAN